MVGTLLAIHWNTMSQIGRRRALVFSTIVFGSLTVWIGYDLLHANVGVAAHAHIQHPRMLWLVVPMLGLLLFLQLKTLSGISRGRMWTAFLLRATIFNLLILALAGLQMVIERDTLSVLFALDCSKSVPEEQRQKAIDFMRKAAVTKKANDE